MNMLLTGTVITAAIYMIGFASVIVIETYKYMKNGIK